MEKRGIVLDISQEKAIVRILRSNQCGKCNLLCARDNECHELVLDIPHGFILKVGDTVALDLDSSYLLLAAAIVYLLPLICLVIGVVLGTYVSDSIGISSNVMGLICGLLFASLSFIIIRVLEPRIASNKNFIPKLRSVVTRQIKEDLYVSR